MVNTSNLTKRILSGTILAAAALFCLLYSVFSFHALLLIVALLAYAEWLELTKDWHLMNKFGGLVYIGLPVWSLIVLHDIGGAILVLCLFAMVWATDIAAYFGGKAYGKRKLAPSISPGKTWEGLAFGILAAAVIGSIVNWWHPFAPLLWGGAATGAAIAIISQIGDLFESWLKRRAGMKDSSQLIPGHGGVLDRIDGLIFAAPVFAVVVMV